MLNLPQESDLLRKVPMFSKLEPSKLKLLAFISESFKFENAEEPALVRGWNALIGEMGTPTNPSRSASVRARGEVTAMRINAEYGPLRRSSEQAPARRTVARALGRGSLGSN